MCLDSHVYVNVLIHKSMWACLCEHVTCESRHSHVTCAHVNQDVMQSHCMTRVVFLYICRQWHAAFIPVHQRRCATFSTYIYGSAISSLLSSFFTRSKGKLEARDDRDKKEFRLHVRHVTAVVTEQMWNHDSQNIPRLTIWISSSKSDWSVPKRSLYSFWMRYIFFFLYWYIGQNRFWGFPSLGKCHKWPIAISWHPSFKDWIERYMGGPSRTWCPYERFLTSSGSTTLKSFGQSVFLLDQVY